MIKVYKSDTGQFVLVHTPTQTFIMDENLEQAYTKLEAHVAEHHAADAGAVMAPTDKPPQSDARFRLANALLLALLALLPFIWILVMHYSLAALITDLRWGAGNPVTVSEEEFKTLREDVDFMRFEQNRMLEVLHRLTQGPNASALIPAAGQSTTGHPAQEAAGDLPGEETPGISDDYDD